MRRLWKPTLMLTGVSVIALAVGFVSQLVTAALFGAGSDLDAFLVAGTLPSVVTGMLVGSLNLVLIPLFVEWQAKNQTDRAWRLASAVLNMVVVSLGLISIVCAVLARPLISLTAPGLPPQTMDLAVRLARWMWPTIIGAGVSSVLVGIYQSQERFGWPALVPILTSAMGIAVMVGLAPSRGVAALAVAALVSSISGAVLLSPIALSKGRYRFVLASEGAGLRPVVRLMGPLTLARLFSRVVEVAERFVASGLPAGSVSCMGYARTITGVSGGLLTSGISTTIFPLMSQRAAEGDMAELRRTMSFTFTLMAAVVFPIVAVGAGLARPLVAALLERGHFGPEASAGVAAVLPWYLLTLVGGSLGIVVGKGFYVLKDTRAVAFLGAVDAVLYLAYMPILARSWGYVGVGAAAALFVNFSLLATGAVLWLKLGAWGGRRLVVSLGRISLAALAAGAVSRWGAELTPTPRILAVLVGGGTGTVAYASALWALRSPELGMLLAVLKEPAQKARAAAFGVNEKAA